LTRFSVTPELQILDITVLRFGVGALLLPLAVLRRGSRLPAAALREGPVFAVLWGVPFVLLVALGLKLTSAAEAAAGFGHRNRHHRPSSSRCRGDLATGCSQHAVIR
jgi:drug/metabolite transporter (DMT)-like permease